ncbi:hypothetical protein ACFL20_03270 [Spirochaetota bacterium]
MLSSVLNSDRAINVNIQIMRAFTQLRKVISSTDDIRKKINNLEEFMKNKFEATDNNIQAIISVINWIINPEDDQGNIQKIGFKINGDKSKKKRKKK